MPFYQEPILSYQTIKSQSCHAILPILRELQRQRCKKLQRLKTEIFSSTSKKRSFFVYGL
jgi:hypothetical protein